MSVGGSWSWSGFAPNLAAASLKLDQASENGDFVTERRVGELSDQIQKLATLRSIFGRPIDARFGLRGVSVGRMSTANARPDRLPDNFMTNILPPLCKHPAGP